MSFDGKEFEIVRNGSHLSVSRSASECALAKNVSASFLTPVAAGCMLLACGSNGDVRTHTDTYVQDLPSLVRHRACTMQEDWTCNNNNNKSVD